MKKLLLCVGAAKTGTTWLYMNLLNNPGLWFSPEKEIHYHFTKHGRFNRLTLARRRAKLDERLRHGDIDDEMRAWYERFATGPIGPFWYRSLFREMPEDRWACDFSPSTSLIPAEGWTEVAKMAPEMKYVYIMREPQERLWSHAKFHAAFIGKSQELKKYSLWSLERFVEKSDLLVDGNYGTNLSAMLSAVPRERVLLLDYARIRTEPDLVLREVEDFIGLPRTPGAEARVARRVNVSEASPPPPGFGDRWRRLFRRETSTLVDLGVAFAEPWARLHAESRARLLPWF